MLLLTQLQNTKCPLECRENHVRGNSNAGGGGGSRLVYLLYCGTGGIFFEHVDCGGGHFFPLLSEDKM
jgi:hypothetical protein